MMPDYKKKKRSKLFSLEKKEKKRSDKKEYDEIEMYSDDEKAYKKNKNLKIVAGKKKERQRRFRNFSAFLAVVVVIILVLELILPAGIFETVKITANVIGSGSFPLKLESTETLNTVTKGSYYYVLSNTHFTAFSNSGKELFSYSHGFENPILKTSASRAMVFDQGGTAAHIFDINKLKTTITSERPIITAAISDNGSYAIATTSEKYVAAVTVYEKDKDKVYEWYSAEDIVNSIALSRNGKKLAVAVFNSSDGGYKSKLTVLKYDSATPVYSEEFSNDIIYSIDNSFASRFAVVTSNKIKFIKWSNYKAREYSNDYTASFFDSYKKGYIAVFARESDKTDNRIAVFGTNGKLKYEFGFTGRITDITVRGSHVYCMSETEICVLGKDGKLIKNVPCGFGGVNICVPSSNTALL